MGGSSCQEVPGIFWALGDTRVCPGGADPRHLVPRPEKGHRVGPGGEGRGVGAGGESRRGDSSSYCSQVSEEQESLGTLVGAGGGAGQRLCLVLRTLEHIPSGKLPVTLLCFCTKCLPLKVDPVADSLVYDKIALGIPPICDFLPPPPGKPHVRSQLLPVLRPLARPWAGHTAGALRVGTLFPPPLSFGRSTCLFHGRRSWLLQEALCGERGRHLRKSAIGKDRSQGHRKGQEQAGASGSTARAGLQARLCAPRTPYALIAF